MSPGDGASSPREWADRHIRMAGLVTVGLIGGVGLFTAVVAFLLVAGTLQPAGGIFNQVTLLVVACVALGLIVAAPIVRARAFQVPGDADRETVAGRWATATIVGMALRETAGLVGLSFAAMTASLPWTLGFGLATIASMALAWPRGDDLRERLRRVPARRAEES